MTSRSKDETSGALAEGLVETMAEKSPSWLKPYLQKAAPVIGIMARILNMLGPVFDFIVKYVMKFWAFIQPYHPEELAPMFIGVLLMMFGGYFMTLIACIEAYRMTSWDTTKECLIVLWNDYKRVKAASKQDDLVDDDGDGISDVHQISKQELVTRKMQVFMKATDPQAVSNALGGLYTGFIAMSATLKLNFARTIALGVGIGDVFTRVAKKVLLEPLRAVVPAEYHKWIPVTISYVCKSIGISIAWTIWRILSAFHSAVRGAQIFTDAFAVYTARLGYMDLSQGYYDEAFSGLVAFTGLYLQLSTGFSLPWLLALPLSPLLIVEKFLAFFVIYDAY